MCPEAVGKVSVVTFSLNINLGRQNPPPDYEMVVDTRLTSVDL